MSPPSSSREPRDSEDTTTADPGRSKFLSLSASTNGSLKGLDYHSALLQRLQVSEQLLEHFKSESAKLYQDNCRLSAMLKSYQESASFLQAPEANRIKQFMKMTETVRIFTEERSVWARQHADLTQEHQKLSANFNNLRELHAVALKDIGELRAECAKLRESGTPVAVKNSPNNVLVQQPQRTQNAQTSLQLVPVRWPLNAPAPPPAPSGKPTASTLRRMSAPVSGGFPGWAPGMPQFAPSQISNSTAGPLYVPSNAPSRSSRPSLSVNTLQPFNHNVYYSSPITPMTGPQQILSAPPIVSTVHNPIQNNFLNHTTNPATSNPTPQNNTQSYQIAPFNLQRPLKRKSATPLTPALPSGSHSGPQEMVQARTPLDQNEFTADLQNGPISSRNGPSADPEDGLPTSNAHHDKLICKKQRVEISVPDLSESPVETKPNREPEEKKSDDDESNDDEVEVEVDADGLRLPKSCVSIIMEADKNDAGVQSCRNCHARFSAGLVPDAPKPFVQATLDELIQHCMNEHPAAWDHLRRNVG